MPRTRRVPSYGLHKPSGQARVIIDGEHIYLGLHGSPESHETYSRHVAEWLARRSAAPKPTLPGASLASVNELLLAFWRHAKQRYVKNGQPTSEVRSFRTALQPIRELYGGQPVTDFGPLALAVCRDALVEAGICRTRVNQHLTRIRGVFKWGVSVELVPVETWQALLSVPGVRRGQAKETEPVRAVPEEHVMAIEPYVTPQIWAMVQLQLWTGCRPGEACDLRTFDLKMSADVWEYRPASHKTEHHGKERVIYLGPHAQAVIKPWLKSDLEAYLFSPREAREWFQRQRAQQRKTPRRQNGAKRKRTAKPKRQPGEHYSTCAYDHAVSRACQRAGVPSWAPNQLRHTASTKIRAAYGIEAAKIILGHSAISTSEIYAERDHEEARRIMARLG